MKLRHQAKEAILRAKEELSSNNPIRYKYAALELRFALEAITYSRALAYKDEIPPEEYSVWQPKKVMQLMLDINPFHLENVTLRIGEKDSSGNEARVFNDVGSETALTMKDIKEHYDALGSYLHMPSLEQMKKESHPDTYKLRTRCTKLIKRLESILQSNLYNMKFNFHVTLDKCMKCSTPIRVCVDPKDKKSICTCRNCGAKYTVTDLEDNQVHWKPHTGIVPCLDQACSGIKTLWVDDVIEGTEWVCDICGVEHIIKLMATVKTPATST